MAERAPDLSVGIFYIENPLKVLNGLARFVSNRKKAQSKDRYLGKLLPNTAKRRYLREGLDAVRIVAKRVFVRLESPVVLSHELA